MKGKLLKILALLFTCATLSAFGVACDDSTSSSSSSSDTASSVESVESENSSETPSTDESVADSDEESEEESEEASTEESVADSEEESEEESTEESVAESEEESEEASTEESVAESEEESEEASTEESVADSEEDSEEASTDESVEDSAVSSEEDTSSEEDSASSEDGADTQAPVLRLASESTINATVGEQIVLSRATATDNVDGTITSNIKVEVVGTEHVTGCVPGGTYTPKTAGTQRVVYSITDAAGNESKKEVVVNVATAVPKGDILGGTALTSSGSGVGLADKEYVYDQKVSMILNISQAGGVQFNVRGPVTNNDWPTGIVIRIDGTNGISVSARKHDSIIYGRTVYSKQAYMIGRDILFEYQTKNVTIADVEYIRTQIWVQGEELTFTADENGLVGLETGVNALYRKVSDFLGNPNTKENIYSSPFWMSAYNTSATVKELRMDGTSCDMPAEPEIPDGYKVTFNTGDKALITTPITVSGASNPDHDAWQSIGKYSNEEYVAITFNGQALEKGAFCVNVTGTASGWNGGLVFRISQDSAGIYTGGPNATQMAGFVSPYENGHAINATSYTLVYKLTYVKTGDLTTGVSVDVWFGEANGALTKRGFWVTDSTNAALKDTTLTISSKAFTSAENITPGDITVMVLGALNGTCDWTVSKVEILSSAPNA